jgi:NAD(P)-dependent dehydrogenase (short-subunit alcohol dehydrogenase family)
VFAGVRTDEDAESIRAEDMPGLQPLMIDVADSASIASARDTVAAALGGNGLAGLVNNAGIAWGGPMEYFPMDEIRGIFDVNYFGAVETTQAFLPYLKRDRGRIVLMSSSAGRLSVPFNAVYSSTKFALEAFGDALRIELKPWGIDVISVEPGAIDTPIWEKAAGFWGTLDVTDASEEVQAEYTDALNAVVKATERFRNDAIPVKAVSKAVRQALTTKRPKTRQTVGRDAWIGDNVLRRLPDRLADMVMRRFIGLPG